MSKQFQLLEKEDKKFLNLAKKYFPKGTEYYSAYHSTAAPDIRKVIGETYGWWVNSIYKKGEALSERDSSGFIWCQGTWAKRVDGKEIKNVTNERGI